MKKSLFLWLIVFLSPFFLKAQDDVMGTPKDAFQRPNYDTLQKMMTENPNLYPSIEARFLRADFSLTDEEMNIFYYGKIFRDDYSPYHSIEWPKNIKQILYSENPKFPKKSLLKKELKNINQSLADYPVSLEGYFIKYIICIGLYGDTSEEVESSMYQLLFLLRTIARTGDGTSMGSAIHVTHVSDEHTIMRMMGFSWKKQSLLGNEGQYYDRFELDENENELEELFFNITPCYNALNKLFSE